MSGGVCLWRNVPCQICRGCGRAPSSPREAGWDDQECTGQGRLSFFFVSSLDSSFSAVGKVNRSLIHVYATWSSLKWLQTDRGEIMWPDILASTRPYFQSKHISVFSCLRVNRNCTSCICSICSSKNATQESVNKSELRSIWLCTVLLNQRITILSLVDAQEPHSLWRHNSIP